MKKIKLIWLLSVFILSFAMILAGCARNLKEPVFVRSLISSTEMDFEIQYIANKGFEGEIIDVEIVNMPDGMNCSFYGDDAEKVSEYDVHTISFGISADDLDEAGNMVNPLVFHELNVEWDNGDKESVDIGTIQVMAAKPEYSLEIKSKTINEKRNENTVVFHATKRMTLTGAEIPYPDVIKGMTINDQDIHTLSQKPIMVDKGEDIEINYIMDFSKVPSCGYFNMDVLIQGFDANEKEIENVCMIMERNSTDDAEWIETQIKNYEKFRKDKMVVKPEAKADIEIIAGGFDTTAEDFIEEINKDLEAEGLSTISRDYKKKTRDSILENGEGKIIETTVTDYQMEITDSIDVRLVSVEDLDNKIISIVLRENLDNGSKHDKNFGKYFSVISKNVEPRFNAPEFTIENTNKNYVLDCLTFWCANVKENNAIQNLYVITTNEEYFGMCL